MKKLLASLSVFCAISANAFAIGNIVQMTNINQETHPASFMHSICTYESMTGDFRIRIVVQGMCPFFIRYNILNNTWSR